jgi:Zn-dependent oligopeptidase
MLGTGLPEDQKQEVIALGQRLTGYANEFKLKIGAGNNAIRYSLKDADGLPETVKRALADAYNRDYKKQHGRFPELLATAESGPWLMNGFSLPLWSDIMTHAHNSQTRADMNALRWHRNRAGTNIGQTGIDIPREYDTRELMENSLGARRKLSTILGCTDYPDLAFQDRVAVDAAEVQDFLFGLARRVKPAYDAEMALALAEYSKDHPGADRMPVADELYYYGKVRKNLCSTGSANLTEEEIMKYFPVDHVLTEIFAIYEEKLGISIEPVTADTVATYHPDVQVFRVSRSGKFLGEFYLDLYQRKDEMGRSQKHDGAYSYPLVARAKKTDGSTQPAVSVLMTNFPRSTVQGQPALLTLKRLRTLFHELGHTLHAVAYTGDNPHTGFGMDAEWDTVETHSQFMELFGMTAEHLVRLSRHKDTEAQLEPEVAKLLMRGDQFGNARNQLFQIAQALIDLEAHLANPSDSKVIDKLNQRYLEVCEEIGLSCPADGVYALNAFAHIWINEAYAAGYYSYAWARAMAAAFYAAYASASDDEQRAVLLREISEKLYGSCNDYSVRETYKRVTGKDFDPRQALEDLAQYDGYEHL